MLKGERLLLTLMAGCDMPALTCRPAAKKGWTRGE